MSGFQGLPRELRDMIYGYCLIHDKEIIPYPTENERKEIQQDSRKPAKRTETDYHYRNNGLRPCGTTVYAADWPCVALLGVSRPFVRRQRTFSSGTMSSTYDDYEGDSWIRQRDLNSLWYRNVHYFRHITNPMSMNDVDYHNPPQTFRESKIYV